MGKKKFYVPLIAAMTVMFMMALGAVAVADTVTYDADLVVAGIQTAKYLGPVAPGAVITTGVTFDLVCAGQNHVDYNQSVLLNFAAAQSTIPAGGSMTATNTSIGTIPASWPDDTTGCPSPAPTLADNGNSTVTITAPTTPGFYTYVARFNKPLDPGGNNDPQAITGGTTLATFTLTVDTTAPAVTVTPDRGPDHNGWYNAPVVFTTGGTDAGGIASCTAPQTYSTPDGEDLTVSGSCTDDAGNVGNGTSAAFDFDDTDPTAEVTGYEDGDIFVKGEAGVPPTPGCTFSDATAGSSGIDATASTGPTLIGTGLTVNGVGSATYRCTARDLAGNSSIDTETYSVVYGGVSGILQPINADNTSIFKRGQAVPVKFKLAGDEYFGFDTSDWTIQRQSVACAAFDGEDADLESAPSNTPATLFRYDATADQYIYNADMKNLAVGSCWKFEVHLDSGQNLYSAVFKLAK